MKSILVATFFTLFTIAYCIADTNDGVLSDPRPSFVRKVYSSGETVEGNKTPYVFIVWKHPREDTKNRGYQIWGDDRILNKSVFIEAIRILIANSAADIYIVGNEWAAGTELKEIIQDITEKHKVDAYLGSPYLFTQLAFRPETDKRKKVIGKIIDESQKR